MTPAHVVQVKNTSNATVSWHKVEGDTSPILNIKGWALPALIFWEEENASKVVCI